MELVIKIDEERVKRWTSRQFRSFLHYELHAAAGTALRELEPMCRRDGDDAREEAA